MEGELLSGGNLNPVVKIGEVVHRPMGPWSESVHQLLLHLKSCGFEGAPLFLGVDAQGREMLSFIPGEVGFMPYVWSQASLIAAARLLRRFHDTTVTFVPPLNSQWQRSHPDPRRHEVICHVDFAPYNLVFRDQKPYALIDFDFAGPGPRLWDIAIAAYWFVPLSFSSDLADHSQQDIANKSQRLHLFCSTYGISANSELLDTVEARLSFLCDPIQTRAQAGEPAWLKMREEGHLAHWQRELAAFQSKRPEIERNL